MRRGTDCLVLALLTDWGIPETAGRQPAEGVKSMKLNCKMKMKVFAIQFWHYKVSINVTVICEEQPAGFLKDSPGDDIVHALLCLEMDVCLFVCLFICISARCERHDIKENWYRMTKGFCRGMTHLEVNSSTTCLRVAVPKVSQCSIVPKGTQAWPGEKEVSRNAHQPLSNNLQQEWYQHYLTTHSRKTKELVSIDKVMALLTGLTRRHVPQTCFNNT